MTDIESKQQPDIIEATDADPLNSAWLRYLASIAMTAVATVVAVGVDTRISIPNLSLVFVVPVIIAGLSLGLGPSLCAAIVGALAFNFFLTEPRYSLAVDAASDIWAIALLLAVGFLVSGVAFNSGRRASEAFLLRRQASVLQGYSREVVAARTVDTVASITSRALAALFRVPAVVILIVEGKVVSVKRTGDANPSEVELEAARSALATGTVLHSGIYPYDSSRFDFWPVQTPEGQSAVVGLAFDPDERPATPDTQVRIVASILALVLERQHGRSAPN